MVTSGKDSFSGGADLTMLEGMGREYRDVAKAEGEEAAMRASSTARASCRCIYRKLETCGKPFAAAINGVCMGGGFELALACHYRVIADDDKTRVGLPEIKVGLFPGAGGTQRVARLMPTPDALQMLFKGDQISPPPPRRWASSTTSRRAAKSSQRAKDWVKANPGAKAPWDDPKFKLPSGKVFSPARHDDLAGGQRHLPPRNLRQLPGRQGDPGQRLRGPAIADGSRARGREPLFREDPALEGSGGDDPHAVRVDGRAEQGRAPARRRRRRPTCKKIGVLGAGFMGAGIAYVSAIAGLDVVLIDRDQESADKGKAHSEKLISSQIAKGRAKSADRDALLARITPSADYAALKGCDLDRRGGVRGSRGQEGGDREGAGGRRPDVDLRQQHLDPADHLARGNLGRSRTISSASISSRPSTR